MPQGVTQPGALGAPALNLEEIAMLKTIAGLFVAAVVGLSAMPASADMMEHHRRHHHCHHHHCHIMHPMHKMY